MLVNDRYRYICQWIHEIVLSRSSETWRVFFFLLIVTPILEDKPLGKLDVLFMWLSVKTADYWYRPILIFTVSVVHYLIRVSTTKLHRFWIIRPSYIALQRIISWAFLLQQWIINPHFEAIWLNFHTCRFRGMDFTTRFIQKWQRSMDDDVGKKSEKPHTNDVKEKTFCRPFSWAWPWGRALISVTNEQKICQINYFQSLHNKWKYGCGREGRALISVTNEPKISLIDDFQSPHNKWKNGCGLEGRQSPKCHKWTEDLPHQSLKISTQKPFYTCEMNISYSC